MKNRYLKLFACCLITKGATRATLADVQRNNYIFLPLQITEILQSLDSRPLDEVLNEFDSDDQNELKKYFEYLVINEYAFYTNEPSLFPPISLEWKASTTITNAILDYDHNSAYNIPDAIDQLEDLGCPTLQIRLFNKINYERLADIARAIENGKGRLRYIQLMVRYDDQISQKQYLKLTQICTRICNITVHAAPYKQDHSTIYQKNLISYIDQAIDDETHCGFVNPKYFRFNIKFFAESQNFNTCLNRKISVDKNGYIRNCPAMEPHYGHLDSISLAEVANHNSFRQVWEVNKNQINVCKDCEFRHICTDCRAFTQTATDLYAKPLKCKYDPYSGQWQTNKITSFPIS